MKDFDFFKEEVFSSGEESEVEELVERKKKRLRLQLGLIVLVGLALLYLAWGLRESARYHLNPQPIVDLGRVDERDESAWPHDRFVRLRGVPEHRGAQASWIRGLSWNQQYWYFHLLGSPVFIEVPADEARGSMEAFKVATLEGRLLDLRRSSEYDRVMRFFEGGLFVRLPERAFLLQVNVRPDQGSRYLLLYLILLLIPAVNFGIWYRAWRALSVRQPKI